MSKSIKDIINAIPQNLPKADNLDFLNDEAYIDSCQDIINEALGHGYDVLNMENGDIITTGTKVIVTQYRWDDEKKKMIKVMSKQKD
jgi:hypothetical protein